MSQHTFVIGSESGQRVGKSMGRISVLGKRDVDRPRYYQGSHNNFGVFYEQELQAFQRDFKASNTLDRTNTLCYDTLEWCLTVDNLDNYEWLWDHSETTNK